jgi:hypothetical protein
VDHAYAVLIIIGGTSFQESFFVFCAVLREPLFDDVTVREGALLKITCVPRNIPAITTTQILDSRGMVVPSELAVVTIDSAFRNASGVYTCLITNTLNNNTINATATVVVECKLIKYIKVTVFLFLLKIRRL